MNATKQTISLDSYPGYPTTRLVIEDVTDDTNLTLPEGPWTASVNILPDLKEQDRLRACGYELDDLGRPLHPWLREMVSDPEVGVVTGLGEYWQWGPNRTADPIVMNDDPIPKILLIQRSDTGVWALPGGFIDGDEQADIAAKRELLEETGLLLVGSTGHEIYTGVVADLRTTAHAWAETTALTWIVEGTPEVHAGDDAVDAQWFAINNLPNQLHGSHAVLIDKAITQYDDTAPKHHTISLPFEITSYAYAQGGHMAYHHLHAVTSSGSSLFLKSHDKHVFTDPVREAHSKQYLHKEASMYDHLRQNSFSALPSESYLEADHTLILSSLDTADGWHWQAPRDAIDHYIRDALTATTDMQSTPLPNYFHDTLLPTFDTHIKEGWPTLDAHNLDKFAAKMNTWKNDMTRHFQDIVPEFLNDLPQLQSAFESTGQPETYVLSHHDFRQANIAWHPDHGTKIVDWSWAGVGRQNSDATTFLIDLNKSGHDVSDYLQYFNADHALTLIGFWVAHSLWPTREIESSVRFHQAVSAVSAYELLVSYRNSGDVIQSQPRPRN